MKYLLCLQVLITVGLATASQDTWAPAASARRARPAACTWAPAGKPRASRSAAGEESAAATSACATSPSSARSTAASASATTSRAPGTKASSAQVWPSGVMGSNSAVRVMWWRLLSCCAGSEVSVVLQLYLPALTLMRIQAAVKHTASSSDLSWVIIKN